MSKEELTKEEQVNQAVEDFRLAYLADLKANEMVDKVRRQKDKAHNDLRLARARLATLEV